MANAVDEGLAKAIVIGEAKGKAEDEAKLLLKVVKNMVTQSIDDTLILQATGISEEELAALKEKLTNG